MQLVNINANFNWERFSDRCIMLSFSCFHFQIQAGPEGELKPLTQPDPNRRYPKALHPITVVKALFRNTELRLHDYQLGSP